MKIGYLEKLCKKIIKLYFNPRTCNYNLLHMQKCPISITKFISGLKIQKLDINVFLRYTSKLSCYYTQYKNYYHAFFLSQVSAGYFALQAFVSTRHKFNTKTMSSFKYGMHAWPLGDDTFLGMWTQYKTIHTCFVSGLREAFFVLLANSL